MPEPQSSALDSPGNTSRPWYLEYGVPLLGTLVAALIVVMFQTAPVAPFMLAVIVAAWFGGTRAGLVAMGLAFIAIIPLVDGLRITRLLFFVVISGCMIWVIASERRASAALRRTRDELQRLSRRLLEVQEEERRNLARELHDEFGQLIATANLHLHAARSSAGEAARAGLDNCAAVLQQAGDHVRSLALELRPAMLETLGLDATLRWLARQQREGTGIRTEVVGSVDEPAGDRAVACFRVAQEALTNVVKHAKARHAWIEVGERDGRLELAVRDDGAGFDVARTLEQAAARGQLGLLGMRERVQILGGDLRIESQPGRGTHVQVSFPRT